MPPTAKRFSFKAPPPKVALVSDAVFFVRSISVAAGATAADVASQVDLTLESLAPFALAQMYYAHHWTPGAPSALIYAAYRKRFTTDESDEWHNAEIVMPRFAALLSAKVQPATTVVLTTDEAITAIHWGENAASPSTVVTRSFPPDTAPGDKLQIRDELLRGLGGSREVIDLDAPPAIDPETPFGEYIFRAGPLTASYSREQLDALDIRDKDDLAARRAARARDIFLWRGFVACVAGVALAGILELALIGGHAWQRSRHRIVAKQAPVVADIMNAQMLATRIEELATNRLRPVEMIEMISAQRPPNLYFNTVTTSGLYSLDIRGQTAAPPEVTQFQSTLRQLPQVSKMDAPAQDQRTGEGVSQFRIVVTFKPDAFSAPASTTTAAVTP